MKDHNTDTRLNAAFDEVKRIETELAEAKRIRQELKTARRIETMKRNRTEPLLTERVAIRLSKSELVLIKRQANEKGLSLSNHLREIVKNTIA